MSNLTHKSGVFVRCLAVNEIHIDEGPITFSMAQLIEEGTDMVMGSGKWRPAWYHLTFDEATFTNEQASQSLWDEGSAAALERFPLPNPTDRTALTEVQNARAELTKAYCKEHGVPHHSTGNSGEHIIKYLKAGETLASAADRSRHEGRL